MQFYSLLAGLQILLLLAVSFTGFSLDFYQIALSKNIPYGIEKYSLWHRYQHFYC